MKTVKISIVVPIYNAEKYLYNCLESIKNQTFQDFEVWLIDDGSTDSSSLICDKYEQEYPYFHTFHKKNAGVSSARNKGIELSVGQWICFIDSDDAIETNYLGNLYKYANEVNDDILIIQGFKIINSHGGIKLKTFQKGLYLKEEIAKTFSKLNINRCGFPFAKLYNSQIIKDNNILFIDEISYAEDVIFMLTYLCHVKGILTIPGSDYKYYIRNNPKSLSQQIFSLESEHLCYINYRFLLNKLETKHQIPKEYLKKAYGVVSEYLIRRTIGALYLPKNRKNTFKRIKFLKSISSEEIKMVNTYYKNCAWFHRLTMFLLTKHYYYLCDLLNNLIAFGRIILSKI